MRDALLGVLAQSTKRDRVAGTLRRWNAVAPFKSRGAVEHVRGAWLEHECACLALRGGDEVRPIDEAVRQLLAHNSERINDRMPCGLPVSSRRRKRSGRRPPLHDTTSEAVPVNSPVTRTVAPPARTRDR